ncbi:MAG: hypothetical protein QXR30_02010 [Candidatus Woesearchaeota archaeon]
MESNIKFQNYTVIDNPIELRRNLLLISKLVIQQMMSYEKLQILREEKQKLIDKFKITCEEINSIYDKIHEILPQVSSSMLHEKEEKSESSKSKKGKSSAKIITSSTEEAAGNTKIEKLYNTLKELESKIEKLQ